MFEIIKMTLAKTNGNVKAYFSFKYAGFVVNGATIYSGKDGQLAVGMPSQKGKNDKYYSICYFDKDNADKREELLQLALEEYNRLTEGQ